MALRQRLQHSRLSPWAAAIGGAAGWALHHQLISDLLHFECRRGNAWSSLGVGLGCLLLMAAGVAVTLASRDADGWSGSTRRFVASLSLMGAGLFTLPVLLQIVAAFVLPGCDR